MADQNRIFQLVVYCIYISEDPIVSAIVLLRFLRISNRHVPLKPSTASANVDPRISDTCFAAQHNSIYRYLFSASKCVLESFY